MYRDSAAARGYELIGCTVGVRQHELHAHERHVQFFRHDLQESGRASGPQFRATGEQRDATVRCDRDPGIDLILGRAIRAKFDSTSAYPSSACGTPYTSERKSDDQHASAFKHITAAESFCIICHLGLLRPRMLV